MPSQAWPDCRIMPDMKQTIARVAACLALLGLLAVSSCFDPEPASLSVSCTFQGMQRDCDVVLESPDGKISRRTSTNIRGIGEFRYLLPGDYIVRFVDARDNPWPAVREVSLRSGETRPLRVELSEKDAPQPQTEEGEQAG